MTRPKNTESFDGYLEVSTAIFNLKFIFQTYFKRIFTEATKSGLLINTHGLLTGHPSRKCSGYEFRQNSSSECPLDLGG